MRCRAGLKFAKLGVNLRMAVNIPVNALVKIAVADIVQTYRPQFEKWPGLIIDMTEEQIVTDLALATEITKKLQPLNVKLAIDDFGRGYSSLVRLEGAAVCRTQARPRFRHRLRHRQGQCAAVQDRDRPRAQFRQHRGGDRHRKGVRRAGSGQHGLRLRSGLPARPADAGGAFHLAVAPARHCARRGRTADDPARVWKSGRPEAGVDAVSQCVQAPRRVEAKLSE